MSLETLPAALFQKPPVVRFFPEREVCHCGGRLVVQKTRHKTVLSMTGPFTAHETVLECSACGSTFDSEVLLKQVPKWCNVAYDVLVFAGQALFQRYRTVQEVRAELLVRNVRLSASEISYLGRKFISYLAIGHHQATPRICQSMRMAGGYILHLDATHDGDAPALMTGIDSLSRIVLGNVKVPTEHSDHIVPFLKQLQNLYGIPQACVHDMGKGICKAVAEVFPTVPDFICHFHFLRDIGKDFLEITYRQLRSCLREHKTSTQLHTLVRETRQLLCKQDAETTDLPKAFSSNELPEDTSLLPLASVYSLALWVLHGKHCGDGYGFPFDRPLLEFAERIKELNRQLAEVIEHFHGNAQIKNTSFVKLTQILSDVVSDPRIDQLVKELQWRSQTFDRLRDAMRIAMPFGHKGINDDGTNVAMASIRQGVEQFRSELAENPFFAADTLSCKMVDQIDKYKDKLFADPIEVDTPEGTVIIHPQRTNNILEQFFRGVRRGQRRKTGNNSIHRLLQTMLANTPLVKNLDNPDYMEILLDGKANLEDLFAELDMALVAGDKEQQREVDRILPGYQKLIRQPNLPAQVVHIFSSVLQKSVTSI